MTVEELLKAACAIKTILGKPNLVYGRVFIHSPGAYYRQRLDSMFYLFCCLFVFILKIIC